LPFGIYFTFGSLGGAAGPWMVLTLMGMSHNDWRAYWLTQAVLAVVFGLVCALMVGGSAWLAKAAHEVDLEVEQEARAAPANARVYRTPYEWTVAEALRTPQFYILVAAYFSHLLVGVTVASLSVTHLTELGVAAGVGFGLTVLAVTVLLLNYYGRQSNLELFSLTCLVGAVSAAGPFIGGAMRDRLGSFAPTFQLFAGVTAVIFLAVLVMRPPKAPAELFGT
jgi:hypothetical protein